MHAGNLGMPRCALRSTPISLSSSPCARRQRLHNLERLGLAAACFLRKEESNLKFLLLSCGCKTVSAAPAVTAASAAAAAAVEELLAGTSCDRKVAEGCTGPAAAAVVPRLGFFFFPVSSTYRVCRFSGRSGVGSSSCKPANAMFGMLQGICCRAGFASVGYLAAPV